MYEHTGDLGWVWMTVSMMFWLVLLGAAVYIAVKLANDDTNHRRHP